MLGFMQGDLLNQLLEQNAHSGIKAQGPAAQKAFQVVSHQMHMSYTTAKKRLLLLRPWICFSVESLTGTLTAHACVSGAFTKQDGGPV